MTPPFLSPLLGLVLAALPPQEGATEVPGRDSSAPARVEIAFSQPGAPPPGPPPAAAAAWRRFCEATRVADASREPVRAFDLVFDGRSTPDGQQTNDFNDARYRYLAPGWVSSELGRDSRLLRGPRGDWLIDRDGAWPVRGRESREDKRQLDDTLGIARNFTALVDPASLRLGRIELLREPPPHLHESLLERRGSLTWLRVSSPDLILSRRPPPDRIGEPVARVASAWLGLDPATSLPDLAVVLEEVVGESASQNPMLVQLRRFVPLDGYRIPAELTIYPVVSVRGTTPIFAREPELQLWFKRGSLRPPLTAKDFQPPE